MLGISYMSKTNVTSATPQKNKRATYRNLFQRLTIAHFLGTIFAGFKIMIGDIDSSERNICIPLMLNDGVSLKEGALYRRFSVVISM